MNIELPCHGITIQLNESRDGGVVTCSPDLHERCPGCSQVDCNFDCDAVHADNLELERECMLRQQYNAGIDAILSMTLAHCCAGIPVQTASYLEGIETAIDALSNNLNEGQVGVPLFTKHNDRVASVHTPDVDAKPDFTCPRPGCGSHTIEEIMVDGSTCSEVTSIDRDSGELTYGNASNDGGYVDRYQCGGCGLIIVNDDSPEADDGLGAEALIRALKNLDALEEIDRAKP